jgi:hypothetical protein
MNTVNRVIRAEFQRVVNDLEPSVQSAAKKLGVSRQTFHSYLNGSATPRSKRLAKAIKLWKLEFNVANYTPPVLPQAQQRVQQSKEPLQLELWQALDSIKARDLDVTVKRVGKSLRVAVEIAIRA